MIRIMYTTEHYTPAFLQAHPDALFLFGDNADRTGKGGQAVIRDEPNAFGIAAKWWPDNNQHSFFDTRPLYAIRLITNDFIRLEEHAEHYEFIVVPLLPGTGQPSLGCGLADLPNRNPVAYQLICDLIEMMENSK